MNIKVNDDVIMPESNGTDDAWRYGGFAARVADILDSGLIVVEDADGDFFTVEASRVERISVD